MKLEHPLMNAAGTVKDLAGVERMARSPASAIVLGSITVKARGGNSGEVYHSGDGYSINSLGMPNPGIERLERDLPRMVEVAHASGKKLIVSVAGFSPEEFAALTRVAILGGADMVELNFGCPNIWEGEGGTQKRIIAFSPRELARTLAAVENCGAAVETTPTSVKLSPYSDPYVLGMSAETLNRYAFVNAVTVCNTFPNAFAWDDDLLKGAIDPAGGLGGLGGAAMKPIALGQIIQLRQHLDKRIQIIGAGGIRSGRDIQEFLAAGANAVQIATHFMERGEERSFGSLLVQMLELEDLTFRTVS